MATVRDLPGPAQTLLGKLGKWITVYRLVDELGWSQTEVVKWISSLEESGWVESKVMMEGSPMGGPATGYRRKESPSE